METLVGECRYTTSGCDFDLTFDLAVVAFYLLIVSRLYVVRNRKMEEVDTWKCYWLRGVVASGNDVT